MNPGIRCLAYLLLGAIAVGFYGKSFLLGAGVFFIVGSLVNAVLYAYKAPLYNGDKKDG